jgi:predicted metal-dependent hydrolase
MSKKRATIAALIASCQGQELDAHYLGYFECFNRGLFYESHEVLEELWLPNRDGSNGPFYKGLIQLAGAFVHMQKGRPRPAAALLKLAQVNLQKFPAVHERLEVTRVLTLIGLWLERLQTNDPARHPLSLEAAPRLALIERGT